jgi:hypothetical protein
MTSRTFVVCASLTWLALVALVGSTPQTRADTFVVDQDYLPVPTPPFTSGLFSSGDFAGTLFDVAVFVVGGLQSIPSLNILSFRSGCST